MNGSPLLPRYKAHISLDDGHNAFNAFVLGFVDLVLADEHYQLSLKASRSHYQTLLARAHERLKLSAPTWEAFFAYLKANKKNSTQLQKDLAPLFRHLAVDWYNDAELFEHMKEQFDEYVYVLLKKADVERRDDEIPFRRQPNVLSAFRKIAQPLSDFTDFDIDDETLDDIIHKTYLPQLETWWKKEGCRDFKEAMRHTNAWAGTLELSTLGKMLDIDIIISFTSNIQVDQERFLPHILLQNYHANDWFYIQDSELGRLVISTDANRSLLECFTDSIAHLPKVVGTHKHISAHPDGNCAFNGFTLGFCDRLLAGLLDTFSDFPSYRRLINDACHAFGLPEASWAALKMYVETNKNNPLLLQLSFAPLFRRMAAEQYEHQDLLPALSAEFREYAFRLLHRYIPERGFRGGDIFKRIPFIVAKFTEFHPVISEFKDLDVDLTILDDVLAGCFSNISEWWELEGFTGFREQMNRSGEWAGDMELGYLGDCFQINVRLMTNDQPRSINECYGFLPLNHGFSQEQLAQLKQRSVIKQTPEADGRYAFREVSPEQLREGLSALPFHEAILNYFMGQPDTGEILAEWIPGLKARDLIMQERGRHRFIEDIDFTTLFSRICEFENALNVIALHAEHYRANPCLAFSNPMAAHWYYEQEIAKAQLKLVEEQPIWRSSTPNPGRVRQGVFADEPLRNAYIDIPSGDIGEQELTYANTDSIVDGWFHL